MQEPCIVINGVELNKAQSMTIRCALEHVSWALYDNQDEELNKAFLKRIEEIRKIMGY